MTVLSIILLVTVIWLLQKYTFEHSLDGLSYEMKTDRRIVECGEVFEMISSVENSRRLPVLFLRLSESVPAGLSLEEGSGKKYDSLRRDADSQLEHVMYVMPRERAVRHTKVSLPSRGRYLFHGARLSAGDLLGLQEKSVEFFRIREVICVPARVPLSRFEEAFGGYLGEISVRRFIMPDPIDSIGFREYTGHEPQRDISWKETLRRGSLMVRQYDHTAEKKAILICDTEYGSEEDKEYIFSLIRSISESFEEKHISFSFAANAWIVSPSNIFGSVPDGVGPVHLQEVFEILGRAKYDTYLSAPKLLQDALKNKEDGRSIVFASTCPERRKDILQYYEARGTHIFVIGPEGRHALS